MLPSRCKCSCKSLAKNVARISNRRRSQSLFEAITTAGPLSCRWSKDMVTLGVPALLGTKAAPRHLIEVMSPIYNWSLWLQLSCDRARCACVRLTGSREDWCRILLWLKQDQAFRGGTLPCRLKQPHFNCELMNSYFIQHTCGIFSHVTSLKACPLVPLTYYNSPVS